MKHLFFFFFRKFNKEIAILLSAFVFFSNSNRQFHSSKLVMQKSLKKKKKRKTKVNKPIYSCVLYFSTSKALNKIFNLITISTYKIFAELSLMKLNLIFTRKFYLKTFHALLKKRKFFKVKIMFTSLTSPMIVTLIICTFFIRLVPSIFSEEYVNVKAKFLY